MAPLLIVGVALGPQGLGLLPAGALAAIDPAIPVALAVLGTLLGLGLPRAMGDRGEWARSVVGGAVPAVLVAAALFALARPFPDTGAAVWALALVGGIAAASSLTWPIAAGEDTGSRVRTYLTVETVWPVVAGGLALAWLHQPFLTGALWLVVQGGAIALVLALAAWLLVQGASSPVEQRIFAVAAVLLVGGAADQLASSALLAGLVAGLLWHRLGGEAREGLERDVRYARHPLVALVLVVAGARAEVTAPGVALAAVYLALRTAARLGGWRTARRGGTRLEPGTATRVVAPGVFGVAFALNAYRAVGADLSVPLSAIVFGSVAGDVLARLLARRRDGEGVEG